MTLISDHQTPEVLQLANSLSISTVAGIALADEFHSDGAVEAGVAGAIDLPHPARVVDQWDVSVGRKYYDRICG